MFAENTMVRTKQNYDWNACIFKYSILGEKKESRIVIQSEGKCGIKNKEVLTRYPQSSTYSYNS